METEEFYWCLHHQRVEAAANRCRSDDRLGPYPTAEAARNWRQTVEERNEDWKADEDAWNGEDER